MKRERTDKGERDRGRKRDKAQEGGTFREGIEFEHTPNHTRQLCEIPRSRRRVLGEQESTC